MLSKKEKRAKEPTYKEKYPQMAAAIKTIHCSATKAPTDRIKELERELMQTAARVEQLQSDLTQANVAYHTASANRDSFEHLSQSLIYILKRLSDHIAK